MTILTAIIMTIIITITVIGVIYLIFKAKQVGTTPDTFECRAAVHEAGHAITAWWSTDVTSVTQIYTGDSHGHVQYYSINDCPWSILVICLAGIAAELMFYKKIRVKMAEKDLLKARELAKQLDGSTFPWHIPNGATPPFTKIYLKPLSEQEELILTQAYQFANFLLKKKRSNHYKLMMEILKKKSLNEKELINLLGNRAFIKVSRIFGSKFVY